MELAIRPPEPIIKQQRKPRYRRVAGEVNFRLTKRDLEILKLVFEKCFLSSDCIWALVGGSRQGVLRRLTHLFRGGYLDRPPEQIRPFFPLATGRWSMLWEIVVRIF